MNKYKFNLGDKVRYTGNDPKFNKSQPFEVVGIYAYLGEITCGQNNVYGYRFSMNDAELWKVEQPEPQELWIELKNKNQRDGDAVVYSEKVDGLNEDAIHVIEKSAYDELETECKLREQIDGECIGSLQQDLEKLRADLDLAIEALKESNAKVVRLETDLATTLCWMLALW